MGRLALVALAIFLVLFGIAAVTNIRVEWMGPITGFAALVAGVLIGVAALRNAPLAP